MLNMHSLCFGRVLLVIAKLMLLVLIAIMQLEIRWKAILGKNKYAMIYEGDVAMFDWYSLKRWSYV